MATAAGAAVLLYVVLSRRLSTKGEEDDRSGGFDSKSNRLVRRRLSRRPAQAPATWLESITTLSETLRFTYAETLGKWPIGDLAFGINYLMRRQVGFALFSYVSIASLGFKFARSSHLLFQLYVSFQFSLNWLDSKRY